MEYLFKQNVRNSTHYLFQVVMLGEVVKKYVVSNRVKDDFLNTLKSKNYFIEQIQRSNKDNLFKLSVLVGIMNYN